MAGLFTMKTARDLMDKVERDYKALSANPMDTDACFNFFVSTNHLPEWYLPGNETAAQGLRRSFAILRICSQIGNGAKHFELQKGRHTAITGTHVATVTMWYPPGMTPPPTPQPTPPHAGVFAMTLDTPEETELGTKSITVLELADKLMLFWRSKIL